MKRSAVFAGPSNLVSGMVIGQTMCCWAHVATAEKGLKSFTGCAPSLSSTPNGRNRICDAQCRAKEVASITGSPYIIGVILYMLLLQKNTDYGRKLRRRVRTNKKMLFPAGFIKMDVFTKISKNMFCMRNQGLR